ncbi:hypothetical protein IDH50_07655 [Aeromicrobium tamlense]|uniref:Uncharacterized protein n=1 Tax=Aeromicrobium tamlense TaxID=375541 RepID=A0A8I0FVZ3_9ACTN|nr:hypothetical protein [Aeromicrobium tamlense]MBD1270101.1 hypothetical protein [Aeromicrobium tamlense]
MAVEALADGVAVEGDGVAPADALAVAEGAEEAGLAARVEGVDRFGVDAFDPCSFEPGFGLAEVGREGGGVGAGAATGGLTEGHVRDEESWNTNATDPPCGTFKEVTPRLE